MTRRFESYYGKSEHVLVNRGAECLRLVLISVVLTVMVKCFTSVFGIGYITDCLYAEDVSGY